MLSVDWIAPSSRSYSAHNAETLRRETRGSRTDVIPEKRLQGVDYTAELHLGME